jgi:hypothetical protein
MLNGVQCMGYYTQLWDLYAASALMGQPVSGLTCVLLLSGMRLAADC